MRNGMKAKVAKVAKVVNLRPVKAALDRMQRILELHPEIRERTARFLAEDEPREEQDGKQTDVADV